MLKSELLEREAEARRLELAATFDELRARATPGHVLDQLIDYATEYGGGDFLRNLRDQTVANPLALGLVGAGLAWLMLSSRKERRRPDGSSAIRGIRSYLANSRERASTAVSGARDRVADVAQRATEAADSIATTAKQAKDAASTAASSLRNASLPQSQDLIDFCRDQPLVLAGLGVAVGAAMGAALPSTEAEHQLLGEASGDLKEQTRAFAAEQYEKSKSAAGAALGEVHSPISEGGQQSVTGSSSIVPSQPDKTRTEVREATRPEKAGPRDGRS
jgi:ElaB/YqjD/DUF883 family membrane-anchored ribosome-binding protein